jgi:homoserine kinase type II
MNSKSTHSILLDLHETCSWLLGMDITDAVPVKRGWLNLKWKIHTEQGVFLLKQYNVERFKKYNTEHLLQALSAQPRLNREELPCPKLVEYLGDIMLRTKDGERVVVMEYCAGENLPPGKLNACQMYDLGQKTGAMHHLLNDGTLGKRSSPHFIPPTKKERLLHWEEVKQKAKEMDKRYLLPYIELQYETTERTDPEHFVCLAPGWAHRDLWVDNLLFMDDGLTAILDFDRMTYDYPDLDVARAILSGALNDDHLDVGLVSAFVEGYRETRSFPTGQLAKALRMLWYLESACWINEKMDDHSIPPARFATEMIWLAENERDLESMLVI